jgi:hypothetical protein
VKNFITNKVYTIQMGEISIIFQHSNVFNEEDYNKDDYQGVLNVFDGINLTGIYGDSCQFVSPEELINTLNVFFQYEMDIYEELLEHFIKDYLLALQCHSTSLNKILQPVKDSIKGEIGVGLYESIFEGNTTNLKPEDIFTSVQLLEVSKELFAVELFTSKVVAKGVSLCRSDLIEMVKLVETMKLHIIYKDLVQIAIKKDSPILLNYLKGKCTVENMIFIEGGHSYYLTEYMSKCGSIECLRLEKVDPENKKVENVLSAARGGSLICLEYLLGKGYSMDPRACYEAALGGHLDCIKYAHNNGVKLSAKTFRNAARGGSLICLEYLRNNGCDGNETFYDPCHEAARSGNVDCLKYLHKNGYNANTSYHNAIRYGNLDCLVYLTKNTPTPTDEKYQDMVYIASEEGSLDMLMYLIEEFPREDMKKLIWDSKVNDDPAGRGHSECLKYVHYNIIPCTVNALRRSIMSDRLDCLKFIHSIGVVIDENCLACAVSYLSPKCAKYLLDNGFPYYKKTFDSVAHMGYTDCIECIEGELLSGHTRLGGDDMLYHTHPEDMEPLPDWFT